MIDNIRAEVAAAIRAEMARKGVDQRTLAKQVGRSQAWLSKLTQGKTTCRVEDLALLAQALRIPVQVLIPHGSQYAADRTDPDRTDPDRADPVDPDRADGADCADPPGSGGA